MRLTGFEAIEFAEKEGLMLHKKAGSIDEGADALTVAEAAAIAEDDPDAIWVEVAERDYYGGLRNMEPGATAMRAPRRAGQRPEELLPGEDSGSGSHDEGAAGTAGGGLAAGGLAGTNAPNGEPGDEPLEDAMAFGYEDRAGDEQQVDEPQAGRSGGAVGGTPAGKRASPR